MTTTINIVNATLQVAAMVEELKYLHLPALHNSLHGQSVCCCNLARLWAYPSEEFPEKEQATECRWLEKFFREKGLLGETEPLVSPEWEDGGPENCFSPLWPLARFVRKASDPLGRCFFGDGELEPALAVARAAQSAYRRDGAG